MESQRSKVKGQKYKLKFKIIRFQTFYFWIALLPFAFLILHLDKAEASALSLGISPSVIKIQAAPEETVTKTLVLENRTDQEAKLGIVFMPFQQSDAENGQPLYNVKKEDFFRTDPDIFQKIKIYNGSEIIDTITLAPKQKKNLTLSITLPKDERPSDYYFSIVFIAKDTIDTQNIADKESIATMQIKAGIATHVLLSVSEKHIKAEGIIEEFTTPTLQGKGPVQFALRVKNTGNTATSIHGVIIVKNLFGQAIGKIMLKPTYVLANSSRNIPLSWPENFILGPYTAYLTLTFDNGPIFGRTIYFFGFPMQFFLGIISMIILFVLIKNRIKKHLQ